MVNVPDPVTDAGRRGVDSTPIAERLALDPRKLPAQVFERYAKLSDNIARRRERARRAYESFGKPGRDPHTISSVLSGFADSQGWRPHLLLAGLDQYWDQVAGPAIAAHTHVASYRQGVLTIRAESNVWATQLTYLIPQLQAAIAQRLEGLPVDRIVVTGPGTTSFRRGRRRW